jgi:hypothetical protein
MAPLQPDLQSGDHYKVLGVSRDASDTEISKAFKRLALKYHPDKNQTDKDQSERNFKRVSDSYSVLGEAQKRRQYDRKTSPEFLHEADDFYSTLFGGGAGKGNTDLNTDPFGFMSQEFLGGRSVNIDVGKIFGGYGLGNKKSSVGKQSSSPHPTYALPVNTLVVIRGLVNAAEHNGKTARVEAFDETQRRYKVILDDDFVQIMVKPRNLTQLCSVEVIGIEGRPELDGALGLVLGYRANNSEYVVELSQSQEEICIHRSNCLLKEETRIILEGLNNEKFNGEMGNIVGVDRCQRRYVVQCPDGGQVKVKFDKVIC